MHLNSVTTAEITLDWHFRLAGYFYCLSHYAQLLIDISCLRGAQQQTIPPHAAAAVDRLDRQMDEHPIVTYSGKSGPTDQVALHYYYTSPSHWCTTHEVSKL